MLRTGRIVQRTKRAGFLEIFLEQAFNENTGRPWKANRRDRWSRRRPCTRAERSGYCLLAAVLFRLTDLTAFRVGLGGRGQESGGGEEVGKSGKAGHGSLQWRRGKWVPTA